MNHRTVSGAWIYASTLIAWAALSACESGGASGPDGGAVDGELRRPRREPGLSWSVETVATGGVGLHARVADANGTLWLAWYRTQGVQGGPCTGSGVSNPAPEVRWRIEAARETNGSFAVETVDEILSVSQPLGLDLAIGGGGQPVIAAQNGEPLAMLEYCGANDLAIYRRGGSGWSAETVVTSSGQAATGEPASDFGEVVGNWPAIAFDRSGNAVIAYRDVHAGAIQSDDLRRADLEVAWQRGGWSALPVDWGRGAGAYNDIAIASDGTAYVVYVNPTESSVESHRGTWLARSRDGAAWERVRVSADPTSLGPSLAIGPDDRPRVVWYDANRGQPRLATLTDSSAFTDLARGWSIESFGDPRFDEGLDPSIAIDSRGRILVAYYRCADAEELGDCAPTDDALVFAYREADASAWTIEPIDEGERGECGRYPSLATTSSGPVVAYLCRTADDTVRLARRDPF